MAAFAIRPYRAADLEALYSICLATGADGKDASGKTSADLLGGIYVGPYCALEPASVFVLTLDGQAVGYILGAADTPAFLRRCEAEWWPALRRRHPASPQPRSWAARLANQMHQRAQPPPWVHDYPAHLHINILPVAQGQGQGRALMQRFLAHLRGQPGVHLEVSRQNPKAIAFYKHCGFTELGSSAEGLHLGLSLARGCFG